MANSLASGQKPTGVTDLDSSQTLSNKTLDSSSVVSGSTVTAASIQSPVRADVKKDTLANLQTYALTASNGQLCFATDAKKMYQVLDAALAEVGSGQGGINYISNPDFELNADGWTGDTNLTIARSTSAPLRGDASGLISKAAVDASGEVVKIPFTIESADLAKKLYISFDKDASDANYADADLRVEIIKDPNGTPVTIRCNAEDILGGKGTHLAWFQSDASILEYELVFKCNSANASAYVVKIDNVQVGPREVSYGSAMTDWVDAGSLEVSATTTAPTKGTATIDSIKYKRNGDSATIQFEYYQPTTAGASSGSGMYLFKLPSNLKIDSNKQTFYSTVENWNTKIQPTTTVGIATFQYLTSGDQGLVANVVPYNEDYVAIMGYNYSASGTIDSAVGFGTVADIRIAATFTVPIKGWSSNSIQSEDIGNREVRVRGAGNAGQSLVANTTDIPFIVTEDTTSSWNGTQFTAPETGDYIVDGSVFFTTSPSIAIFAYIDGVQEKQINVVSSANVPQFDTIIRLQKGEVLSFRVSTGVTLINNSVYHYIHIQKLAQPQTILETETVAARYTSNSGQAMGTSNTDLKYEDIDFDTHNAYDISTGIYTAPVTGFYDVSASYLTATTSMITGNYIQIGLIKNGALHTYSVVRPGSQNSSFNPTLNTKVYLEKGDEIKIVGSNTNAAAMNTVSAYNFFTIARIK